MIDCPETLHSGAEFIISLSIYIRSSAFKPPSTSQSAEPPKIIFNEGQETVDEQALRERKISLLRLFDAVGLQPQGGAGFPKSNKKTDEELHAESLVNMTTRSADAKKSKVVKTEIVGDGEEVEVEDGEDLSDNELDMIYRR